MAKSPKTGPKPGRAGPKAKKDKAAKSKPGQKPLEAKADAPQADKRTVVLINEKNLNGLLRTCKLLEKQGASITGDLREKIGYAKEKQGLDSKAFAMLRKFDKMEAEAAARLWDTLGVYMTMSGVMEKIESVGEFDFVSPDGKAVEVQSGEEVEPVKPADNTPKGSQPAAAEGGDEKVVSLRGGASATAH